MEAKITIRGIESITEKYDLSEIKNGHFMFWSLATSCRFACTVRLTDETGKEYFKFSKASTSGKVEMMPLGQGNGKCTGNRLTLEVTSETSIPELKQSINSYNVTDSKAKSVGHGYNICIEDYTDEDYNDIFASIVGWVSGV